MSYYFRGLVLFLIGYSSAWLDATRGPGNGWYFLSSILCLLFLPAWGIHKEKH